mgnify:CR=1 FL=1
MDNLVMKAIVAVVSLMIVAVCTFASNYLRQKLTDNEIEMLKKFIKVAVQCANQIYTKEEWKQKKGFVMEQACAFLNEKLNIKLTVDQIDLLIEGIVNEVKNENIK